MNGGYVVTVNNKDGKKNMLGQLKDQFRQVVHSNKLSRRNPRFINRTSIRNSTVSRTANDSKTFRASRSSKGSKGLKGLKGSKGSKGLKGLKGYRYNYNLNKKGDRKTRTRRRTKNS